ncbi:Cyclophilin type peptidyl-prolyl cis-trans isomerase/CLD [Sphingobacterium daejeonense]|nr:Cyclophilin type peptidyl-prolyl cis-trans isomerase/CLD [Sphingobacterium daejeonense]
MLSIDIDFQQLIIQPLELGEKPYLCRLLQQKRIEIMSKAIIKTEKGDMTVQFYTEDAPNTVANFIKLAKSGVLRWTSISPCNS